MNNSRTPTFAAQHGVTSYQLDSRASQQLANRASDRSNVAAKSAAKSATSDEGADVANAIHLPMPLSHSSFSNGTNSEHPHSDVANTGSNFMSMSTGGGSQSLNANVDGSTTADGKNDSSLSAVDAGNPVGVFPELDELAEQIGEFIHYWGFKRIHGRIWTHLYLAKRPVDAGELVSHLQISKALVSISLRELLDYEVIRDIGKSPRGTNLYRTNPDILSVITSVLRQREKRMLSRISAAQESLSRTQLKHREEAGICDENLGRLKEMVARASDGLDSVITLGSFDLGSLIKVLKP